MIVLTKCSSHFSPGGSGFIVTPVCRILFIFWTFLAKSLSQWQGGQVWDYEDRAMLFRRSKTLPARENKPISDRSPQLGERCRFLFTVGFATPKNALRHGKNKISPNPHIGTFLKRFHSRYGSYNPSSNRWYTPEKSYVGESRILLAPIKNDTGVGQNANWPRTRITKLPRSQKPSQAST